MHGRTRHQSSEGTPVSLPSIKFAVEAARGAIPVLANGDVWTRDDCEHFKQETGANAVMSDRGLLANPVGWLYAHDERSLIALFLIGALFGLHGHAFRSHRGLNTLSIANVNLH